MINISKRIEGLLDEYDMSVQTLADKSGLPTSTIKNILYESHTNPTIYTIEKLCEGFGISLIDFFNVSKKKG